MDAGQTFRIILTLSIAALLPIGIYHRLKSQMTRERLDRLQEGLFILVSLRLCGLLTLIGLIAYVIGAAWISRFSLQLPIWLRWIGAGLLATFVMLMTWVFMSLGKNLTDTVVTRAEQTLVTSGPYRWIRHPFYCAALLGVVASCLVSANWYIGAAGGLGFILIAIRTRTEEEKLVERFGDEYREYMQGTGRFFPILRRKTVT